MARGAAKTAETEKHRRPIWLRLTIWLAVIVLVGGLVYATLIYTEQPSFCGVCHEMVPYHEAWEAGPHTDVRCITCHVAPGFANRAAHKLVALKEVWEHFTTDPKFPMLSADVPNGRCIACHPETPTEEAEPFAHKAHLEQEQPMQCQHCHGDTGHRVTYAALKHAGILAEGARTAGATYVGEIILGSDKGTTLAGHKAVKCSDCHDVAAADCPTCHRPPKDHYGNQCTVCHRPTVPFAETVFEHPSVGEEHTYRSFPCVDCHPKSLTAASCTRCHEGGAPEDD